jgi:hypothetical protein
MTFGCTALDETNANIFYFESSFTYFWIKMIKSKQDRAAIRTMQNVRDVFLSGKLMQMIYA